MKPITEEIIEKNTLYTDYRAEFVAACLIESGLSADEVRLIREGLSKGGKAIDKISWEYSSDNFSKYLSIYTRKRDMYESLPEGLFHKRLDVDDKKSMESVIESFKHARQVALSASFFFKPFEIEIDRMLIEANLYEMRLEKKDKHDDFVRLLGTYWPILQNLSLDKALFVIAFFSQSYRLTSTEQIAEVLSVFLGCKVDINLSYEKLTLKSDDCKWILGERSLDISTVLGDSISDYFPVMDIQINGLSSKYKDLIYPDSLAYKQFLNIIELFTPADAEINININVDKREVSFYLNEIPSKAPILGFSTVLS